MRKRYVKMKSQTASKIPDLRAKGTLLPNPEFSEHFFGINLQTTGIFLPVPSGARPSNYEKHSQSATRPRQGVWGAGLCEAP